MDQDFFSVLFAFNLTDSTHFKVAQVSTFPPPIPFNQVVSYICNRQILFSQPATLPWIPQPSEYIFYLNTLRFPFCAVISMDFEKIPMLCNIHYNIIWNNLTALKFPCVLPIHTPSLAQPLPATDHFIIQVFLCFFRMLYNWNHTAFRLSDWFLSLSITHLRFLHGFMIQWVIFKNQ